jgi:DNA-binding transcriptional ArsR family regulator
MAAHLKPPESKQSSTRSEQASPEPTTAEILELLGDEYARRVLEAVAEKPRSGRAVAEVAGVSRPTAYRRLNDFRDIGLVTTEMVISQDGQHYERFETTLDRIDISFESGDIEAAVSRDL